ncbi:MAG TPA: hypothetical protein DCQ50_11865 [Chryseobacterium sp.]|nr:hypothetical protein [Chryseobacterium sp.]
MILSDKIVVLKKLSLEDAESYYKIYSHPAIIMSYDESPFLKNETPAQFTERIIRLCEYIFTIRPANQPHLIIGDCALHHWNKQQKSIEIGGSLFPDFWGKGYMKAAFELLIKFSKQQLAVKSIYGSTSASNAKAIRLVQKMGFEKYQLNGPNIIMKKEI